MPDQLRNPANVSLGEQYVPTVLQIKRAPVEAERMRAQELTQSPRLAT
jgi:hypothetical protein